MAHFHSVRSFCGVRFAWQEPGIGRRFRTAVSLHSHTLHSRESLKFIRKACGANPVTRYALDRLAHGYRERHGADFDFARAWWTPPVCAREALRIERRQIEERLDARALVSLTDHDNMDAVRSLILANVPNPIASVEWSVPFRGALLHAGIHNLPHASAGEMLAGMLHATERGGEDERIAVLESIASLRETLVVLNHPLWDELRAGAAVHRSAVGEFLHRCGGFVHALELNGLRGWTENAEVMRWAEAFRLPVVSGGDRHSREPNAILNLTDAATFDEFVEEVRIGRRSQVMCMPQYRRTRAVRILRSVADAVADHPGHSLGQTSWRDRVFYQCDDGQVRSVRQLWGDEVPALLAGLGRAATWSTRSAIHAPPRFATASEEIG